MRSYAPTEYPLTCDCDAVNESAISGPYTSNVDGAGYSLNNLGGLSVGYLTSREVWIGKRTGGKTGSGSKIDPFHSGTATQLKAFINAQPAGTLFMFLDGSYSVPLSCVYKAGQAIVGMGIDATVFEWDGVGDTSGYVNVFIASQADGFYAEGFTMDCRGDIHSITPSGMLIASRSQNASLRSIKIKRGHNITGNEHFPLSISTDGTTPIKGALIEDCVFDTFDGYCTAIGLIGDPSTGDLSTSYISGKIKNCRVSNISTNGYGAVNSWDTVIDGNFADGCGNALNRDTANSYRDKVTNNQFLNCHQYGMIWTLDYNGPTIQDLTIANNIISVTGERADSTVLKHGGPAFHSLIEGNLLIRNSPYNPAGPEPYVAGLGLYTTPGNKCVARNNRVSDDLFSYSSPGVDYYSNNLELSGGPAMMSSGSPPYPPIGVPYPVMATPVSKDYIDTNPNGELRGRYTFTGDGGEACLAIKSGMSYLVATGDVLEYEIWIDPVSTSKRISVEVGSSGGAYPYLRDSPFSDQNGITAVKGDLTDVASGRWYYRQIDLTPMVGATISVVATYLFSAAGTSTAYFRDIKITNGPNLESTIYDGSTSAVGTFLFGDDVSSYSLLDAHHRKFNREQLPVYANNAAAIAGGLIAGQEYRTGANPDPVCQVH